MASERYQPTRLEYFAAEAMKQCIHEEMETRRRLGNSDHGRTARIAELAFAAAGELDGLFEIESAKNALNEQRIAASLTPLTVP